MSHLRAFLPLLLVLPAVPAVPAAPAAPAAAFPRVQDIAWEADYAGAFGRAATEKKVVLLAVNMDGERANDTIAEKVYADEVVLEQAAGIVALVGSQSVHGSPGKTCKRFGTLTCEQHQQVDVKARASVLKAAVDGRVVSPQHVLLGPDGAVILSVPYEIRAGELAWCIVTARRALDPAAKIPMPATARAPRRLIMGGVHDPGSDENACLPLTEGELKEVMAQLRTSREALEVISAFHRILATDHPDAVKFVATELRGSVFGRRVDLRRQLVHDVGRFGHPSFWAAIEPFLKDPDRGVRAEAAAAFEQLGAPESVKALRAAFGKEDAADVRKNLVRALGTAGLADRVVRQQLAKSARSEKDPFVRRNALIALAQTADAEVAREVLVEALEGKDADLARAAALGIAYARRGELRDAVAKAQEARGLDDELYARVLAVLDGANLETLLGDFRGVAGDEIVRERFFAPAR